MKRLFLIIALCFSSAIFTHPVVLYTNFNGVGYVNSLPIAAGTSPSFVTSTIDSNGNIVVVGNIVANGDIQLFIARFTPSGSLDNTFGAGLGYAYPVPTTGAFGVIIPTDIVIQPNGQIIIAARTAAPGNYLISQGVGNQGIIIRCNIDGSLDTTFNGSSNYGAPGYTYIPFPMNGANYVVSIALQSTTNKIFATQSIQYTDTDSNLYQGTLVVAYNPDGLPAPAASGVTSNVTGYQYQVDSNPDYFVIKIGPACVPVAIATVGTTQTIIAGYEGGKVFVARCNSSTGLFDTTFGTSPHGFITTSIGTTCTVTDMVLDSSNNIVVTGYATISGVTNHFIARYLASNGSLDTTFGTGGIVTGLIGTSSKANSITIQTSGEIVITGQATIAGLSNAFEASYTSAGVLDTVFNTGVGYVTTALGFAGLSVASQSNIQTFITTSSAIICYLQQSLSFPPPSPVTPSLSANPTPYEFSKITAFTSSSLYGRNPQLLTDFLYVDYYAQVITDPTAQQATIAAVNLILSSLGLAYPGVNLLTKLALLETQLNTSESDLMNNFYNGNTGMQISQFFTNLNNRITQTLTDLGIQ